jgi:hypothetical protein
VSTDEEFINTLNPGQSMVFRHRVLINSGKILSDEEMNQQFTAFNK